MKKLLLLIVLLSCINMNAQNWTKEIYKVFLKEKKVGLTVDLTEATIMDVSYEEYPEYFCGKNSVSEKYANLILEKFTKRFRQEFYLAVKKEPAEINDAKYVVTYKILNISEKGGFSGIYYVECDGNRSEINSFERKDGRWNDFETLLLENVVKFWKQLKNDEDKKGNPLRDKLYVNKKKKSPNTIKR